MFTVSHILQALETIAPTHFAFSWDKIGLQIGDISQEVKLGGITCLDATESILARAYSEQPFDVVIAHHPLIWDPIKGIDTSTSQGATIRFLLENRIAFIAAHTNWDAAQGGVNDVLADLCGLKNVREFGVANAEKSYKLVTFAPAEAIDSIRKTLEEAGAGVIGEYSGCAFTSEGSGHFFASVAANPVIGNAGTSNIIREVRLEIKVPASLKLKVEKALLAVHPYEEPAYDWFVLQDLPGQQCGRIGEIESVNLREYIQYLTPRLDAPVHAVASPELRLDTIAVFGGGAAGEWRTARAAGAQAMVTGEAPHNVLVDAAEFGFAIICGGHFATEAPAMTELAARLNKAETGLDWRAIFPQKGEAGRTWH